jgi:hypothetical protein
LKKAALNKEDAKVRKEKRERAMKEFLEDTQ